MRKIIVLLFLLMPFFVQAQVRYLIDDVSDIDVQGSCPFDEIGRYPISSGDFNGDGCSDLLIGQDNNVMSEDCSSAYIVKGGTDLPPEIDLQDGFFDRSERQVRAYDFEQASSVVGLGDFNGDGIDDFLLGDAPADPDGLSNAGQAFIKYGVLEFPRKFSIYDATIEGVRIVGSRFWGWLSVESSIGSAGDINGDGFTDALLGAPSFASVDPYREAFIIYGGTDVPSELWTHELGHHGVRIVATDPDERFGQSMRGVGDVNKDGFNDIVIGSQGGLEEQGYAYLIFGATDLPGQMETEALGSHGVRIEGAGPGDVFGSVVSAAGDVNRDGYADFLVSAQNIGKVYLFWGASQWPENLDADNMGNRGVIIRGDESVVAVGLSVSAAGDVNGDGYDDIMMTAYDKRIGDMHSQVSIVFGGPNLTERPRGLLEEYDQIVLERPRGRRYALGYSSSYLGDVNGDGLRDLAIGEAFAEPYDRGTAGTVHIIFGGKFFPTATMSPTITPTETSPLEPTRTPTPTLTPQKTHGFSGWILLGEGEVKVTKESTPTKVR